MSVVRVPSSHRFDQVDAALIEQREYTEFCFSRLEAKMDAGFTRKNILFFVSSCLRGYAFDIM
jgi:hypothetical protein